MVNNILKYAILTLQMNKCKKYANKICNNFFTINKEKAILKNFDT